MKDFDDIDAMDELAGIERRLHGLAWATMLAADYEEKTPA